MENCRKMTQCFVYQRYSTQCNEYACSCASLQRIFTDTAFAPARCPSVGSVRLCELVFSAEGGFWLLYLFVVAMLLATFTRW